MYSCLLGLIRLTMHAFVLMVLSEYKCASCVDEKKEKGKRPLGEEIEAVYLMPN